MKTFPLSNAFKMLDEARSMLNTVPSCGDFTNRSSSKLHQAQELMCKAILAAAEVGVDERSLYRLAAERTK